MLCCYLSVLLMVVHCAAHLQQGFCLQKAFCASERLVLLTLHHLQRAAEVFRVSWWHCHQVEHKRAGITLCDVPCFRFYNKVHRQDLTHQAPTPFWGIAKPFHCKWGWRKDQGQRLSVLAGCSIDITARRKLMSLIYCWTSYFVCK